MELDTVIESMKQDNEKLKRELDRFLSAYHEESTLRVSREPFERLVDLMQVIAVRQDELPCPQCGRPHPPDSQLVKMAYINGDPGKRLTVVGIALRTKTILMVNKTGEEMKEDWKEAGAAGIPALAQELLGAFIIRPTQVTLEDLAGIGVRPFHIVRWLRAELDQHDFQMAARKSTQHMAQA